MLGQELNAIADRYYAPNDPVRKSLSYFAEYERILAPRRNDPIAIIELGVWNGASMLIWRDYLPNATIVGVDMAKEPPPSIRTQPRLHFVSGLQDDAAVLAKAGYIAGWQPWLVLDDCSHIARVTKRSFAYLFPLLAPGGSYVIEDIGTSFLHGVFDDGHLFQEPPMFDADPNLTIFPSHTNGLVGFVKQIVDHTQRDVATKTPKTVPVERVTFISNMAVIEKMQQKVAMADTKDNLAAPSETYEQHFGRPPVVPEHPVKVTIAMMQAGIGALRDQTYGKDLNFVVAAVYRAMVLAKDD